MENLSTKINLNIINTITLLLLLSACAQTSSVKMINKNTGETAQCGPFVMGGIAGPNAVVARESQCISDFQRQGYERTPN